MRTEKGQVEKPFEPKELTRIEQCFSGELNSNWIFSKFCNKMKFLTFQDFSNCNQSDWERIRMSKISWNEKSHTNLRVDQSKWRWRRALENPRDRSFFNRGKWTIKKGKTICFQNKEMKLHQKCRIEHQNMVTKHVMASADWLITFQRISRSKILRMWSVLNLDAEFERLKQQKKLEKRANMKQATEMPKVATMTPVKTPKTRQQKKNHTKVSWNSALTRSRTWV